MNPRVCIITVCNPDYVPIGDITLPALQRYAQKHGYGVELGPYHTNPRQLLSYGDRGKYTLFEKFYNDYDIIMFLDIDAIVMNSDIKVEDVLGELEFLFPPEAVATPRRWKIISFSFVAVALRPTCEKNAEKL